MDKRRRWSCRSSSRPRWQSLLHNQTAWLLKAALLYRRRTGNLERVVIDVPYYLRE